jgi:hypothetical protein
MITPIFRGNVSNNKIRLFDVNSFNRWIAKLNDKDIEIIVRLPRKTRSLNQNSYMWAVVYTLVGEYTGYTTDEVHDAMRMMFLHKGDKLKTLKSTTELSTVEMEEYLEKIRRWSAETLGVVIPLPNKTEVNDESAT